MEIKFYVFVVKGNLNGNGDQLPEVLDTPMSYQQYEMFYLLLTLGGRLP